MFGAVITALVSTSPAWLSRDKCCPSHVARRCALRFRLPCDERPRLARRSFSVGALIHGKSREAKPRRRVATLPEGQGAEGALNKLSKTLEKYSLAEALIAFAALQIDPNNAHQLERLEAATGLALAHARGTAPLASAEAAKLASTGELANHYAKLEDPGEDVLCEEVRTPLGATSVGAGASGQSVFVLKRLLTALFEYQPLDVELRARWLSIIVSALSLSDAVFCRAGIRRGTPYGGVPGSAVSASESSLAYREAVVIDLEDIAQATRILEPLIHIPRKTEPGAALESSNTATARPFVLVEDRLIVAYPFEIASALNHLVASAVIERGLEDEFHLRYLVASAEVVTSSMLRLGMQPLEREDVDLPWPEKDLPMVESVFRFDDDKLAHTLLLADNLEAYESNPVQPWPAGKYSGALTNRIGQVRDHLLKRADTSEVHSVVLLAPLDRAMVLAVPDPGWTLIMMPLFDLEALAFAEQGDPLALWKFSRSRAELLRSAQVVEFSPLDLYVMYRELGHSLALPTEVDGVFARPGGGGELRTEAARRSDVHPARHPSGVVVDVEHFFPHAPSAPIYGPRFSPWSETECLVEHDRISLWIVGPEGDASTAICHAIAYWMWRVIDDIADELLERADESGCALLRFDLASSEDWTYSGDLTKKEEEVRDGVPFAELTVDADGRRVLMLLAGARSRLQAADNSGERELLAHVLAALLERSVSDASITEIIDRRAPRGYKKQLLFGSGPDTRLSPRGLPDFRPVQPHDERAMNVVVSKRLQKMRATPEGEVATEEKKDLLHAYVSAGFEELQERIATLSPAGLLERLVLLNDRVVHEQAYMQASVLTNTMAYGDADESLAERDREYQRQNRAAIATRFLIEVCVAQPPQGIVPLTLSRFDELLALAAEILDAGGLDDYREAGLSAPEILVAPNGLVLFANPEGVMRSRDDFLEQVLDEHLIGGEAVLQDLKWERPDEPIEAPVELEEALLDEVGLSLSEMALLFNTLIDYGVDVTQDGVVVVSTQETSGLLRAAGGWSDEKTKHAIDMFSLGPRPHFLQPDKPHRPSDVYPWRMCRSLSYARRPLLRRGEELVYGIRHMFNSQMLLARTIEAGRFPARRPKLDNFQRRVRDQAGRAFEIAVDDLVRGHDVQTSFRVKRFGDKKLARENGESLGDIDVLAVDTEWRRLILIDAKAVSAALNAGDIVRQASVLFSGADSTVEKQLARAAWVETNLATVLQALGLPSGAWTVLPAIVTDRVLPSAFVSESAVPVVSYSRLKSELARGGIRTVLASVQTHSS